MIMDNHGSVYTLLGYSFSPLAYLSFLFLLPWFVVFCYLFPPAYFRDHPIYELVTYSI